jgi:hypothetical protein
MTLEDYYSSIVDEGMCTNRARLQFYLDHVFSGVCFTGSRVLDVGGGQGMLSFYAATMGAHEVICLEPEAAGHSPSANNTFERIRARLGLQERVILKSNTLQTMADVSAKFDVLVLHNSINHLDEHACIHLLQDEASRAAYREILTKLASVAQVGAKLIVCDRSRHNLFALLRMTNPFAPTIEWRKHQTPRTWSALLGEVGFCEPMIRWTTFGRLGSFGRAVAGNQYVAYLLNSHFCLTMRRA